MQSFMVKEIYLMPIIGFQKFLPTQAQIVFSRRIDASLIRNIICIRLDFALHHDKHSVWLKISKLQIVAITSCSITLLSPNSDAVVTIQII